MSGDIVVNMNFNLGKDQTVDDIVTRLREEVAKAEVAGVLPNWELAKCMWEAADEIEGLRAENRRLHLSLMVAYSEAAGMYDDRNEANHD